MYSWMGRGFVSSMRIASGRLRICLSSLFDPSDGAVYQVHTERKRASKILSSNVTFTAVLGIDSEKFTAYHKARERLRFDSVKL